MRNVRPPTWSWVAALVLGLHLALFWLLSDRPTLPLAAPVRSRPQEAVPTPTPPGFAARETTGRDPRTGEIVTTREFTVPARLATPDAAGASGSR